MSRNAGLLMLSVALTGCIGLDEFESHYTDVGVARRQGAFDRGWLAEILPDEAIDIWEVHQIDTDLTWACFSTPQGPASVRAALSKLRARRVSGPVSTGPPSLLGTREWWPASMTHSEIEAYEFKEDSRFTVAVGVDEAAARVCFHRKGTGS